MGALIIRAENRDFDLVRFNLIYFVYIFKINHIYSPTSDIVIASPDLSPITYQQKYLRFWLNVLSFVPVFICRICCCAFFFFFFLQLFFIFFLFFFSNGISVKQVFSIAISVKQVRIS